MKNDVQSRNSSTTVNSGRYPLDTYLSSFDKNARYGDSEEVWVGSSYIGLFYNSKPNLPTNAIIESATMSFSYYYHVPTGSMTVGAYVVEEYWDEYTVTWNEMATYPDMGISTTASGTVILSASSTNSETNPTRASVDITDIVQSWYSKERSNEGIALKRISGSNTSVILKSYESEDEDHFAYYTITYSTLDEAVVPKGEYYFQNAKFEKFAEIDNNASATDEDAIIEIWDFNADYDQRWNITYLYNGYYKIISTASGKALTAPTSTDASITQTVYIGSNRQQWSITQNTDGTYKLSPQSNGSFYMAAGAGLITARGRNVEMRENQSDNRDDWNLLLDSEYAYLSLDTRIYYDSATINMSTSYMINLYERATAGFMAEFNIEFKTPSTISSSSALTVSDDCVYKNDNLMICGSECGANILCNMMHHKSGPRLIDTLKSNSYYTCRIVGYRLCAYDEGHGTFYSGYGDVNGKNSVAGIYGQRDEDDLILTIQHELTHNLGGASNHECTPDQPCVMQGQINNWCDACKEAIKKNY